MREKSVPKPKHRLLFVLGPAVVLTVVAVVGIWVWVGPGPAPITPSAQPPTFQSLPTFQTPTPVVPVIGDCLAVTPLSLLQSYHPSAADLATAKVSCDGADAYVRIIGVQTFACSVDEGCGSFYAGGEEYYYNSIPQPGMCFYGFTNTAYPDKGKYDSTAWARLFGQCGSAFPLFANPAAAATHLGVDQSDLASTEFQIVSVGDVDLECESGLLEWTFTFSPGTQTRLCTTETTV